MENDPHRRALVKSYVEDGVRWVIKACLFAIMVIVPYYAIGRGGALGGLIYFMYMYSKRPDEPAAEQAREAGAAGMTGGETSGPNGNR
ncbi:hypothetical protein RI054_01g04830 [Pseudoscourfieldia marina]